MADVRAAQLQEDLIALHEMGEELENRVLADVSAEVLSAIREATRVAWLPLVEVNEPLLRAIRVHAGDEGLRDWARAAALRSATSRLFGPIVDALVRMFGLSPSVLLRVPPVAYAATFRGMGELKQLSSVPHCVRYTLRGLPAEIDREQFLIVLAGAIESALVHSKVTGRVEVLPGEAGADAIFEARWPLAAKEARSSPVTSSGSPDMGPVNATSNSRAGP